MLDLYVNIKKLREEKGMSQDKLAKLTGYTVTPSHGGSSGSNGRISSESIEKLSQEIREMRNIIYLTREPMG